MGKNDAGRSRTSMSLFLGALSEALLDVSQSSAAGQMPESVRDVFRELQSCYGQAAELINEVELPEKEHRPNLSQILGDVFATLATTEFRVLASLARWRSRWLMGGFCRDGEKIRPRRLMSPFLTA